MYAFIRDRFMTKAFALFFEMQHATLEVSDHQVIGRVMRQRLSNFFFQGFLPPFKISNMVWFRHDILLAMSAIAWKKREGALGTKVEGCSFFRGVASHTAQARPLGSRIEEIEALQATSFSNA